MTVDIFFNIAKPEHRIFSGAGHNFEMDWFTEYDAHNTEQTYVAIAGFLKRWR